MQIGRLFPNNKALIITIINGLYGTSASMFTIFKLIYQAGVPLKTIFGVYTALSAFCFIRFGFDVDLISNQT